MRQSKQLFVAVVALFIVLGLSGCDKQEQPDFSGYKKIADLATIDCTFHNVAEIYNDGTDIIFGINVGYKKAWFEYDGSVELGVDVSQVRIEGPDASNVVTRFSFPKRRFSEFRKSMRHRFRMFMLIQGC